MTKMIRVAMAAALALWNTPAWAVEVSQEVDVKVQQRFQKTVNGGPSPRPEEYGEIPNGVVLERYQLDLRSEGYVMDVEARNVNQNNQSFKLEGGQPGKMMWEAGWDELPHLFSNEARSPYVYQGNGIMSLGGWRNASLTTEDYTAASPTSATQSGRNAKFNAGVSTALAAVPYARLGFDVHTANLDLRLRPAQDFTVELGGWRQTRQGTKPQPASFGFSNAIELAAPIDWAAHEAFLELGLAKRDVQGAFSYRLSDFDNNIPNLYWDNPKRLTDQFWYNGYSQGDQAAKGALANAPSNRAHALKVEAGVNLPAGSRLSGEAGYQLWTAFNPMLPYTTNGAMTNLSAATIKPPFDASSLDSRPDPNVSGKIEVFTYMGKIATRPLSWLRAALSHEAYILENKSTQYDMPGFGLFDNAWDAEAVRTPREQFRDDKTTLSVDYDVTSWLSGNVGAKHLYKKQTREIPKLREYEGTAGFTFRPLRGLWASLSYLVNLRRGNGMDFERYPKTTSAATGVTYFTEAPGMRRPDLADRNRQQVRGQLNWTAGESTVGLSARYTEDRYRQGKGDLNGYQQTIYPDLFGILSDRQQAVGADLSVPVLGSLTADTYYEYDHSRRYLRSSQTACAGTTSGTTNGFGLPGEPSCATGTLAPFVMLQDPRTRWETRLTENSHIAGVALTWTGVPKLKTVFGYDLTYTRFNGDPTSSGAWVTGYRPFETSRRMLQVAKARGEYKVLRDLTLVANYMYEKFDATDFAYGDVPLRDISKASIFLGANPIRNYYAHTVSGGVNYRF